MLLSRKHKALLLKLRDPQKVTTVVPTAKVIQFKGQQLTAVPHRPQETKVLRNLGFHAPSPIRYHYNWPGRFTPFKAQLETSEFLSSYSRAYCLNSMGTGKSVSGLWAYDFLRQYDAIGRLLVVAPLSTLERTWGDEIFRNFPHLSYTVLHGTAAKRRKLLEEEVDIYIINHEGLNIIKDDLAARPDINLVILDELAMYRNYRSIRWKVANEVVNKQHPRSVWGFTGTPIPNDPTDAWAQCRLLTPDTVPPYFNRFREMTMRQVTQFKWMPKDDALKVVHSAMTPSIRFTLDECVDLPPEVFVERAVQLSPEQTKAYKTMANQLKAEYAGGQILAVNEGVKRQKLLQIVLGTMYAADGSNVELPADDRLNALTELVEQSEGKVIVFVPLTGALHRVAKHLSQTYSVAIVNGETSKAHRDETFGGFQKGTDPHVLVAQPAAMSHGLTLTAATTIVWYGPVDSHEVFAQANARVRRPGQKRTTVIARLTGSHVERRMFDRLRNKQDAQGVLLEMIEANEL